MARDRNEAGLLPGRGTRVLFATIAIIEVPLDFTEVCQELGAAEGEPGGGGVGIIVK